MFSACTIITRWHIYIYIWTYVLYMYYVQAFRIQDTAWKYVWIIFMCCIYMYVHKNCKTFTTVHTCTRYHTYLHTHTHSHTHAPTYTHTPTPKHTHTQTHARTHLLLLVHCRKNVNKHWELLEEHSACCKSSFDSHWLPLVLVKQHIISVTSQWLPLLLVCSYHYY